MGKAAVNYAQYSYKSVSPGTRCPCCGSRNTFYSCSEQSQVCFSCNEVFEPERSVIVYDQREVVPMPYGKILPDLRGSYNYNKDRDYYEINWLADIFFGYLEDTLCPNCGSSNVCCLDPTFNPGIESRGRWYCISCYDSWRYELEH